MAALVLTVIGDDRPGLVDELSGVIVRHGGNWERGHLARLGGKFAGIVQVEIADDHADALTADLAPLRERLQLEITVERTDAGEPDGEDHLLSLQLVGQDRPGIVHEIAHAIAASGISIEELQTETMSAPMAGDQLFEATAVLRAPPGTSVDELRTALEALANELMVDIDLG